MLILGTVLGADELMIPLTPTDISDINKVTIHDAVYDGLYITRNVTREMTEVPPVEWDFDTVLFADFEDETTMAGNLKVSIEVITDLIIKRKRKDEFRWLTIDAREILHDPGMTPEEMVAQMDMKGVDLTATIGYDYEYAAVPVMNGIESVYSTAEAKCTSNGIIILDADEVWMTDYVENNFDTTAVVPNSVVETMWDKYPTIVRNTEANYETIQLTASFIPGDADCSTEWDDEVKMVQWDRKAYDFLRNDKPKLLKATDGRIWLVYITTPPSDTWDQSSEMRKLTFTCTEIGSVYSEADLWDAGLINAGEKWWS